MQIDLFLCTAENVRVDKSGYLNSRFSINGALRNESSIIDPVIIIEKTNPSAYNYMYISEFSRWYYINDMISIRENVWEIHAHVDVLYTWYRDIANSEAILEKCEDSGNSNMYYDDGSFVFDCRNNFEVKEFPNGFNENGSYILICAGGV